MLHLAENNITPEDSNKSSVTNLPTIICTAKEWQLMDKAEATKKDCAERNKLSKPFGNNNIYVWLGIGVATTKHLTNFKVSSLAK
tara:strand:- start:380 stop:634 length:255 start_codon:yes stop_codon:yes gene_type:complete